MGVVTESWGNGVSDSLSIAQGGAINFVLSLDNDHHSVACYDGDDKLLVNSGPLQPGHSFQIVFPNSEAVYVCIDDFNASSAAVVIVG